MNKINSFITQLTVQFFAVFFVLVLNCSSSIAHDYGNNVGFSKNVPNDIQTAFPMCDNFLNVKWLREMPNGSWVGSVTLDIYTEAKKEQREHIVLIDKRRRRVRAILYDVSASSYQGRQLEVLVKSAQWVSSQYMTPDSDIIEHGLSITKDGKQTVVSLDRRGGYPYFKNGFPIFSLTRFTQNTCVTLPSEKRGWFIERAAPFLDDSLMTVSSKEKLQQLRHLIRQDCSEIVALSSDSDSKADCALNNKHGQECRKWLQDLLQIETKRISHVCSDLNSQKVSKLFREIYMRDTDGDGRQDFIILRVGRLPIIAFLNDEKPFFMPFSNDCRMKKYYEQHSQQQEQRCVAENKKKYLLN